MRILHTADIHIGYETHGKINPDTGRHSRLIDFEKCLSFTVDTAIREDIDLFIFAGDGYKSSLPTPTEQQILLRSIWRLCEKNIPIVIVVGNHDNPASVGKTNALQVFADAFPNHVHLFNQPEVRDIHTKSGNVRVLGLPWPMPNHFRTLPEFQTLSQDVLKDAMRDYYANTIIKQAVSDSKACDFPFIICAHLHVDGAEFSEGSERQPVIGKDPVFPVACFRYPEITYVALGHIHKYQNLNPDSNPPIVYSGSIEKISFSEWKQVKGFVILTLQGKSISKLDFIPTPSRPLISIDIKLSQNDSLMRALKQELDKWIFTDSVVRIRIQCYSFEQKMEFQKAEIEPLLAGAFLHDQIEIRYNPPSTNSSFAFPQTLTMIEALERFIDASPAFQPHKANLLKKASEMQEEQERLKR